MWAWILWSCVFITQDDIDARRPPEDTDALDRDGDGFSGVQDCDDADADVFPGQVELPDGVDQDCDGAIDEGTIVADDDGDGFCEQAPCAPCPDCDVPLAGGDCDDTDPTVYPDAPEICDRQKNDCDSAYTEDDDRDGDGFSVAQGDPDDRADWLIPTGNQPVLAQITCAVARVEPATFNLGCEESWCAADEAPVHEVTLTRPFLMMDAEITREQWGLFRSDKRWAWPLCGDDCPATRVSWVEAAAYADALNDHLGLPRCARDADPYTCPSWRLPTEAEWHHAATAGRSDRYAGGSVASLVGWVRDNALGTVHPGRGRAPNANEIYDLTGNVWEWTWDRYQFYDAEAAVDPYFFEAVDPPNTDERTLRGASGRSLANEAHVSVRSSLPQEDPGFDDDGSPADLNPENPFNWIGFRLVRTVP